MILKVDYFENELTLSKDRVIAYEIENKNYFYRFVKDLYEIYNGTLIDEITLFNNGKEIPINNKIKIFTNYFEFDFESKKFSSDIIKYLIRVIEEKDKKVLLALNKKVSREFDRILFKTELPLRVLDEETIESVFKKQKITLSKKETLFENILLIVDLEKELRNDDILIFINLKQYLSVLELEEFYKYAIYNEVTIVLIDSQSYGIAQKYENKLLIDINLEEYLL